MLWGQAPALEERLAALKQTLQSDQAKAKKIKVAVENSGYRQTKQAPESSEKPASNPGGPSG